MPWIKSSECTGCAVCVRLCPAKAISMNSDNNAEIDQALCTKCGRCLSICPRGIIRPNSENNDLKGKGMKFGKGKKRK